MRTTRSEDGSPAFTMALVAETAGNRWMFMVPLVVVPLLPLMSARYSRQSTALSGSGS